MDYLDSLNQRQKEAVLQTEGPLLILAGAGAGKTKTITHRILHIIKSGIAPHKILAITFTNKAAKEMRERVEKLFSEDRELNLPITSHERPFVSTFHSLGVHIIKENASLLGLTRHFSIFDKNDSKRAVKEAIEYSNFDPKQFEPAKLMGAISREKGNGLTHIKYQERVGNEYYPNILATVWKRYEEILRREKALDFDDLLGKTAELLATNAELRAKYQNLWSHVHIDEYQDTNRVQYLIAKLISALHKNICVVGDVDQNIYSWRGADISNILNFEKDYPNAKIILLEENYRSTQTILSAANEIIKKNKQRKEKNLFTKNPRGDKIGLYSGYDEVDEAYFIAGRAQELIKQGVSPREIAVLYRTNFQSRVLEEAFLSLSLPYQVLGVRFFERKEVKDVLSYIRAALNPESLSDIKRIINEPARGLGKVTVLKIFAGKKDELPAATLRKVNEFFHLLTLVKEKALKEKPSEIVKFVMRASGLEAVLKDGTDEDEERLLNIQELVTLATKYDFLPQSEGIEKLLEDAALASDQDSLIKDENAVKLLTVHASKGLEFEYVFISGLEDNLFPHKRLGDDADTDLEEERRLFYVALTRARKKLFLSYAGMRTIFGSRQANIPSEFVIDIDESLVEAEEPKGDGKDGGRPFRGKTIYLD